MSDFSLWTVIEQLIDRILQDAVKPMDLEARLRKKLLGGSCSVHARIEFLKEIKSIEGIVVEQLEKTRRARNKWMHSMAVPTSRDLEAAAATVECLLEKHSGFKIHVPHFFGMSYPVKALYEDHRSMAREKVAT